MADMNTCAYYWGESDGESEPDWERDGVEEDEIDREGACVKVYTRDTVGESERDAYGENRKVAAPRALALSVLEYEGV